MKFLIDVHTTAGTFQVEAHTLLAALAAAACMQDSPAVIKIDIHERTSPTELTLKKTYVGAAQ
jgi:hypothetical protein